MNIELRDFQQKYVAEFVRQWRKAARDARDGDLQGRLPILAYRVRQDRHAH